LIPPLSGTRLERIARHPWKLPVVSGIVLAFAFYPLGLVVTNLVALVPLLLWIDSNLDRPWTAWRNAGFSFGMAVHLSILNWMLSMLRFSFLAIFAYLGLAFVFALGLGLLLMLLGIFSAIAPAASVALQALDRGEARIAEIGKRRGWKPNYSKRGTRHGFQL
jgi:apolipoprotein N-acyltransferase